MKTSFATLSLLTIGCALLPAAPPPPFQVLEASVDQIHAAFEARTLTAHQLVQLYLDRIDAFDKNGPRINSIISINPRALAEADRLDTAFAKSGLTGPLHGIPVLVKDEIDAAGMATTLGTVVFKNYNPPLDAFAVAKLKKAGAIILGKTTLSEFASGDTYGSLFGATHNPYDLNRTVGGSSGGSGASTSANFSTLAVGEETSASIRRPGSWNGIVSMRPTAGVISRTGMYDGYPTDAASMGPMARSVHDLALMLDAMAGYDTEDPLSALGVGHIPDSYVRALDRDGLKGARLGVLRESIGSESEPDSADFRKVDDVFQKNLAELKAAGAVLVDSIVIPDLKALLAKRASNSALTEEAMKLWLLRNPGSPFKSRDDVTHSPDVDKIFPPTKAALWKKPLPPEDIAKYGAYLEARNQLMVNLLKVMADNHLDAIVHKSVEHQPSLIKDGMNPPYVSNKGVPTLNTFLVYVPSMTVPSGFTTDKLPTGITFLSRPYTEATILKLAYAYEQATHHRAPPPTTPALSTGKAPVSTAVPGN